MKLTIKYLKQITKEAMRQRTKSIQDYDTIDDYYSDADSIISTNNIETLSERLKILESTVADNQVNLLAEIEAVHERADRAIIDQTECRENINLIITKYEDLDTNVEMLHNLYTNINKVNTTMVKSCCLLFGISILHSTFCISKIFLKKYY